MGVYALTSMAGAPGVTTTAVAWATLSERPTLLIEADPVGGSAVLAGRLGGRVAAERTVLWLAEPSDDFSDHVWDQTIELPGTQSGWVVPGLASPAMARGLSVAWPDIAARLAAMSTASGVDVVVDMGRWGMAHSPVGLLPHVDALVVMTDPRLPSLGATGRGLEVMDASMNPVVVERTVVLPVLRRWSWRAEDRWAWRERPYRPRELRKLFGERPVLPGIPFRPVDAAVYSDDGAIPSGHDRGTYASSIRSTVSHVRTHAETIRAALDEGITR